METLKTLHAKIEKKRSSINRIKEFLSLNPFTEIDAELRQSMAKYKSQMDELQLVFDKIYDENN